MSTLDLTRSGLQRALERIAAGPAVDADVQARAEALADELRATGAAVEVTRQGPADYRVTRLKGGEGP